MARCNYSHEYEPIVEKKCNNDPEQWDAEKEEAQRQSWLTVKSLSQASTQIIPCLFAVFINLLDAVSPPTKNLTAWAFPHVVLIDLMLTTMYMCSFVKVTFGTCFFPSTLGETGSLGISLFLFSTLVVQVVLIAMSSFQYGMGTSMAENIPFIHTMAQGVFDSLEATHSVQEVSQLSIRCNIVVSLFTESTWLFFVIDYC